MYACKKALAVVREHQIQYELINAVMKSVKYWFKLVELPDNTLPKAAYETVKSLD